MKSSGKPRPRPDYCLETVGDQIILYHPGREKGFHLNETASLIWRLCDGQRTTADITKLLVDAFPDGRRSMETEVAATLERFAEEGALEFV
jgi:hypothetical protein